MTMLVYASLALLLAAVSAEPQNYRTTPVPILKQINRHNDDGSYSYGYEGADGSFKIETKHPTGEVFGKYGYIDDAGELREIEYGASRRGFEPAGTGINVPPPTISNNANDNSLDYDDGQYREDPAVYNKYTKKPASSSSVRQNFDTSFTYSTKTPANQQYYNPPQHQPQQQYYNPPLQPQPQPNYYNPPQQQQQNYHYSPEARHDPRLFQGHPATNFDINTGSYSLSYSG